MVAKVIRIEKDGLIDILEFRDLLNIERAYYYQLKADEDNKTLLFKFYDENYKVIKPYKKKK